jgi:hypothetical protein
MIVIFESVFIHVTWLLEYALRKQLECRFFPLCKAMQTATRRKI